MKVLSIFVDESGDFGPYSMHSPYYIVTMVFHEQRYDLTKEISLLDAEFSRIGFEKHVVHTEPLIRREEIYKFLAPNERRTIFWKLFNFFLKNNLKYKSFIFHKKQYYNSDVLQAKIACTISLFIRDNLPFFQEFDKVILYYDNGQHELSRILTMAMSANLSNCEMRKVSPNNYKLFQVADLLCTLTLLETKMKVGELSKSELLIFHSKHDLKKDFLKAVHKREFK